MRSLLTILLLLSISIKVTAQVDELRIQTNIELGFSKDVLQVKITDSIEGEITVYRFDSDGHLIEDYTDNEMYDLKKTFRYEGNKLVERTKIFKNSYSDYYENEAFVYDGDRIVSAKHTIKSLDENTGDYKDKAVKSFTYENGRLQSAKKVYSGGRKEEEKYFYTFGDSLYKTKLIVDKNFEDGSVFYKEYKNGNRVVVDSYKENESMPYRREIRIYNDDGKLINESLYSDGKKWSEFKYTYENGFLSKSQVYEMGNLREESTYDKFGNNVYIDSNGILPYSYEYNDRNDPVSRKFHDHSGLKITNIRRYEYVYR